MKRHIVGISAVVMCGLGLIILGLHLHHKTVPASPVLTSSTFAGSKASIKFDGVTSAETEPLNLSPDLLNKPIPTNKWWISALTGTWPETLFSTPFTYNLSETGIKTGIPMVLVSADSITTPLQPDIQISFPGSTLTKSQVVAYDDLSVTIRALTKTGKAADSHLVEGSPFEQFTLFVPTSVQLPTDTATVRQLQDGRSAVTFSIRDQTYIMYSPTAKTTFTGNTMTITPNSSGSNLTVAALPSKGAVSGLQDILDRTSASVVTTTEASFLDGTTSTAHLHWGTQDSRTTLFLLLPHQQTTKNLTLPSLGTFSTLLGTARLIEGNDLNVTYSDEDLVSSIPLPKDDSFFNSIVLEQYLQQGLQSDTTPADTSYNGAKELYRLANLLDIAEKAKSPTADTYKIALTKELTDWLTYSPGEKSNYFYYDPTIKGLVAVTPEFDSEHFNDHHFHYGYFLYSAAILGRYDPQFVKDYSAGVNAIANDIANDRHNDPSLPYLRVVDMYAGHSWAGGLARFGDGNDQESVSEAMNAWYGIMLWGESSHNSHLTQLGKNLYNQERTAAETYYFNANPQHPFPSGYNHQTISLLWSGKAGFETWFSPTPEAKHGILYLPLNGDSLYLQKNGLIGKDLDALNTELGGADYSGWQDVLLMAKALQDPKAAQQEFTSSLTLDNSNSLAYMYVWLGWLGQR